MALVELALVALALRTRAGLRAADVVEEDEVERTEGGDAALAALASSSSSTTSSSSCWEKRAESTQAGIGTVRLPRNFSNSRVTLSNTLYASAVTPSAVLAVD